eukprot:TRINITY_DN1569_c0_g1_i3.p1 TRINITY_DN1569_c0_g1~~TRINITY_DN1569_c0_g1_i3.p1  ORF type:complete len:618 (-),score=167.08 TRINITY_DN1569_c0_g1_i3:986-2839(-)
MANLESQYRMMLQHAKSEFDRKYQEMKLSQEETMSLNRRLQERVSNLHTIFKYLKEDPVWEQVDQLKEQMDKSTSYIRKMEYESSMYRSKIHELQKSITDKNNTISRLKEKAEKKVAAEAEKAESDAFGPSYGDQGSFEYESEAPEVETQYGEEQTQLCQKCGGSIGAGRSRSHSVSEMVSPEKAAKEEKKKAEEFEAQKRKQLDKTILEKLDSAMGTIQSVEIFEDSKSKGVNHDADEHHPQQIRAAIKTAVNDFKSISDEDATQVMLKTIDKFDTTVKSLSKRLSQATYSVNENMFEVNKLRDQQVSLMRKMEDREKEYESLMAKSLEAASRTFRDIGVNTDDPLKVASGLAGAKDAGKKKGKGKEEDAKAESTPKHARNAGDMMQWTLSHRKKVAEEEIRRRSFIYRLIAKWNISISPPPIPKIRNWTLNCIRSIYNDKDLQDTMDDRGGKFRQPLPEFVYEWFGKKASERPTADEILLQFLRMCKSLSKVLPEVSLFCKFLDELAFQEDHLAFFLQIRRALGSLGCNLVGNELEVISTTFEVCTKVIDMVLPETPKSKKDAIIREIKGTAMFFDRTVDVAHFLEIMVNLYDNERAVITRNLERALEFMNSSMG